MPSGMQAIGRPANGNSIHRIVEVNVKGLTKSCREGISANAVKNIRKDHLSYHQSNLPGEYRAINPESVEKKQIKNLG